MTRPCDMDWVRLPLEGAHHVRELGGYPVSGGGQTRYHRFLRADNLSEITQADAQFLYDYGVRLVLDLRDAREVDERPDVEIGPDVRYASIPLLAFDMSDAAQVALGDLREKASYEGLYSMILEKRTGMARCFGAIAAAPEGAVLFHCAVGKDRTGVLAMLLMLLAGCDRWDCAANYVQTRHNLMRYDWYEYVWNNGPDDPHYAFNDSPANAVEHALAFVEARGGVVPYLRECGVSYEEIEAVRARLLN